VSRSVKKGPFIEKSLYKKVIEMNKAADRKMIKTYSRCSTIIPEMVGNTISVYNGKSWVPVYITENPLGISSVSFLLHVFSAVMLAQITKLGGDRKWLKKKTI
jgi:small subunit ribosomal protein S19